MKKIFSGLILVLMIAGMACAASPFPRMKEVGEIQITVNATTGTRVTSNVHGYLAIVSEGKFYYSNTGTADARDIPVPAETILSTPYIYQDSTTKYWTAYFLSASGDIPIIIKVSRDTK